MLRCPGSLGRLAALPTLLLSALPLTVHAQERPLLFPSRDVMVEYHVTNAHPGPEQPADGKVTIRATDAGARLRLEIAGQTSAVLVDRPHWRVTMLLQPQHSYFDMPVDPDQVIGLALDPGASYVRRGTDQVVSLRCTVWQVTGKSSRATMCVTDDGVLLRADGQSDGRGAGTMEARSVAYGRQSAALFAPPPGFQKLDLARLLPDLRGLGVPSR